MSELRSYWEWGSPYDPSVAQTDPFAPLLAPTPTDSAAYRPCPTCGTPVTQERLDQHVADAPAASTAASTAAGPSSAEQNSSVTRQYAARRTDKAKVFPIMALIYESGLTLGEVLTHIFTPGFFAPKSAGVLAGARTYGRMVGAFLRGATSARVSTVLDLWMRHPSGLPKHDNIERSLFFSLSTPWANLKHARVTLTSWAAQACARALERETRHVIEPKHGLHALIHPPRVPGSQTERGENPVASSDAAAAAPNPRRLIKWSDVGAKTISEAQETFQSTTPLLWGFLRQVAQKQRVPGKDGGTEYRPWIHVVTGAIGQLLFCRRRTVNLLALQRSLTLFATQASTIVYRIESRFGTTTSYNTVLDSLRTAGNERIAAAREIARSPVRWFKFVFDNVQRYNRQWEMRSGRESAMLKGTAGTLFEMIGFHPSAHDLSEKVRLIAEGRRYAVTAGDLRRLIDFPHVHRIKALHWLQVLIEFVPELACYRQGVKDLFRDAAKEPTRPPGKTNIISLRTNAHDPQYTSGISRALDDYLETQLGQDAENWNRRVVIVGGDGATFEGLLRVKRERQNHDTEHERYEHIEPELELWHTGWTELTGIFAAHCGPTDSKDPSTLRASINLIGRKVPDLSKVEYQSSLDTLVLIGEARMLDCWRVKFDVYDLLDHFRTLADQDSLPTLDGLLVLANELDNMYSSQRAQETAIRQRHRQSKEYRVPEDPEWTRSRTDAEIGEAEGFGGDRVLSNAIGFLDDFLHIREWIYATADGEVGRLYEIIKIILFKFAGSGHNPRYLAYVLETILSLEFECPLALKLARLINWLVNPSGLPGHNVAGDLVQEHHIKPLTAHSRRANAAYDGDFERNVLSPNLDNLVALSRRIEDSVGLKSRSQKHTSKHTNPETRKLLAFYSRKQLHRFRIGRSYGYTAPSRYAVGMEQMPGKLKKFLDACRADNDVFGRFWSTSENDDHNAGDEHDASGDDVILEEQDPDEEPGIVVVDNGQIICIATEEGEDVQVEEEEDSDGEEEYAKDDALDELWSGDEGDGSEQE
ncbi:hypothetical protein EXIGLDRAFT_669591 [Exidia glandulosa HHB12029]|uniref:DUF6589 domain-containing protein n=1 Tax=Exidia glandulosa HHB12029 TaxID=1314781 RepID=A0A165LN01_EXIGL|nr:hypothetical protein EXIGLDRAFT_669591 [Exidia glandulosa HHB12029]